MKKPLVIVIIVLLIGLNIIPPTSSIIMDKTTLPPNKVNVLYVGGNGTGNFTRIQDAIDNSFDGDIVFVYNGTYNECLIIYKSIKLIGENQNKTIINGENFGNVIKINKSYVTLAKFSIINSRQSYNNMGVKVQSDDESQIDTINISFCIIKNNWVALSFLNVSNSSIYRCYIHNNNGNGIYYEGKSNNVLIKDCIIKNNGNETEDLEYAGGININKSEYSNNYNSNVTIQSCKIANNIGNGISIDQTIKGEISNNEIYNSTTFGIYITLDSQNIEIHNNNIYKNHWLGILIDGLLFSCYNIRIYENLIFNNGDGKTFDSGIIVEGLNYEVIIENNNIKENNIYGILLIHSKNNKIFNNSLINNTKNACFYQPFLISKNQWYNNYWGQFQFFPKIIFGWIIYNNDKLLRWFNIDWHPAKEPYDI
jgi:parallel beta-helix repeat protein